MKLDEAIEKMKEINDNGGTCYFKGLGNGHVIAISEKWIVVNKKEKIKK